MQFNWTINWPKQSEPSRHQRTWLLRHKPTWLKSNWKPNEYEPCEFLRSKLRPFSIGICFYSKKSWFKRLYLLVSIELFDSIGFLKGSSSCDERLAAHIPSFDSERSRNLASFAIGLDSTLQSFYFRLATLASLVHQDGHLLQVPQETADQMCAD